MLMNTELVNKALDVAAVAHEGQVDKAGMPYILHPIRVATQLNTEELQVVGLLHDTVEDTEITLGDIEDTFGVEIASIIEHLTHLPDEPYEDYIMRVKQNSKAIQVKRADIAHNMDEGRIANPTPKDKMRKFKYLRALEILNS